MRSFAATIPVLTAILALASAGHLPLTPAATYPATRPTPAPYAPAGPIGHMPMHPNTPSQHQPSIFKLTEVAAKATGTPTSPEKCSQVAARITPQLTPRPTYSPSLKGMADKMGGVDRDTCGNMDFNAKFKNAGSSDLNSFNTARYQTFILPIWGKIHELWSACGEETKKMQSIAQEPCYRWALELSKSSNGGSFDEASKGGKDSETLKPSDGQQGNIKTGPEDSGATKGGITRAVAVGVVGMLTLLWTVVLS